MMMLVLADQARPGLVKYNYYLRSRGCEVKQCLLLMNYGNNINIVNDGSDGLSSALNGLSNQQQLKVKQSQGGGVESINCNMGPRLGPLS